MRDPITYLFKILLCVVLTSICVSSVFSQSHVYQHYGVEDGLPSSEVYSAFQDSKGYMWFATDAGVSRFNGYEFENFDASDGLTDNTVFLITEDSKERVWFGTFNCQLSYYNYKSDSIHPYQFNNKLSLDIKDNAHLTSFHVDSNETLWLGLYGQGLYSIDKEMNANFDSFYDENNESLRVRSIEGEIVWGVLDGESMIKRGKRIERYSYRSKWKYSVDNVSKEEGFFLVDGNPEKSPNYSLVSYQDQILVFFMDEIIGLRKDMLLGNARIKVPWLRDNLLHSIYSADGYLWICARNKGVYKCNIENDDLVVVEHFLPNVSVSRIFKDKDEGYWFLTLKEGVIYMSSENIKHKENNQLFIENIEIDTLKGEKYKNYNDGSINKESVNDGDSVEIVVSSKKDVYMGNIKYNYENSSLLVRTFYYSKGILYDYQSNGPYFNIIGKSYLIDSKIIYKASDFGLSIIKNNKEVYFSLNEGVSKMWCTSLAKVDDKIWIGTKDGIRVFFDKKITNPFKKNKYLSTSITSMESLNENITLIGTKSFGLLIVKNDSIIKILNEEKGLASNVVRTIHVDNQKEIWVGTSKGISRVNFENTDNYSIYNITKRHGLISAEIKDIASYHNMIYVVTPKGLVQFDKTTIHPNSTPPIVYVTSVSVNERLKDLSVNNEFNYQENNIKIVYEGLNYRSLGEVEYQYRMLGVDTTWIKTATRDVRYPTLAFGEYTFQVKAKNEDGIWSKPTSVNFIIRPPFWLTWWFISLIILLGIVAVGLVFRYREKKIIEKTDIARKNTETEKRMVELELKALRSQMNPHFIFNTLNSIQHYISVNDFRNTNRYITQFAKLIRTVLHLSEKSVITIQEEVDMLILYMNLEKMRFNEQFSYKINVSEDIDADYDEMPSMLIQPYVENAIWHGLMSKKSKGDIKINLFLSKEYLCCTIEDNGIGREKAAEIKLRRKIEQKSVGMSITKERLDIINENNINVKTIDLKDKKGNALGTKIEIKIPYKN